MRDKKFKEEPVTGQPIASPDTHALAIQPTLPRNVMDSTASASSAPATVSHENRNKVSQQTYSNFGTGNASVESVIQQIFSTNQADISNKTHWLNSFLSHAADRQGFKAGAYANTENKFHTWYFGKDRNLSDFYREALKSFKVLNNDARINLVCHPKSLINKRNGDIISANLSGNDALEKLVEIGFLAEEGETEEATNTRYWQYLLNDQSLTIRQQLFEIRDRIMKYAIEKPFIFSALLTANAFLNEKEINSILDNATYFDLRVGRTKVESSLRDYIEFLNTLSPKTRLIFLKSKHPLNQPAWVQIPKLEEFTVAQAKKTLLKKTDRGLRTSLSVRLEEKHSQPLNIYLSETNTTFTFADFLSMCEQSDISLKQNQLVRINCDNFSLEDFILFAKPFMSAEDEPGVNGVIACFFNYFMQNVNVLLQVLNHQDKMNEQRRFLMRLLESNQTFQAVVSFAEKKSLHIQQGYQFDPVFLEYVPVTTLQAEGRLAHDAPVFTPTRISNEEYVITTTRGGNLTDKLPPVSRESLLNWAEQARTEKRFDAAAKFYCQALTIQADPILLLQTTDFIIEKKLTQKFKLITTEVLNHIQLLYGELSRDISNAFASATLAETTTFSPVLYPITVASIIPPHQARINIYLELLDYLTRLSKIEVTAADHWSVFYDRLLQFTDNLVAINQTHFHHLELHQLWIEIVNHVQNDHQTLTALTYALQFSGNESKKTIKAAFKAWRKTCDTNLSAAEAEMFFLLEACLSKTSKLENILSSWYFRKSREDARRQTILTNLPVTLENIDDFFARFIENIEKYNTLDDDQKINLRKLFILLYKKKNEDVNIDDELMARRLFQQYARSTRSVNSIATTLIREWILKTTDSTARFILEGQENQLRVQYNDRCFQFSETLNRNEQDHPGKIYRTLLKEMAIQGNENAVLDLIFRKNCFAKTLLKENGRFLLSLITTMTNQEDRLKTLEKLMPEFTEKEQQFVFDIFMRSEPVRHLASHAYFEICQCLANTVTTNRAACINALFSKSLQLRNYDFANSLVSGKDFMLINIAPAIEYLTVSVKTLSPQIIDPLLCLLNLYLETKQNARTRCRLEQELKSKFASENRQGPFICLEKTAQRNLLDALTSFVLSTQLNVNSLPLIISLLSKLNDVMTSKLISVAELTDINAKNESRATLAVEILARKHSNLHYFSEETFPSKDTMETQHEYLVRLIATASNPAITQRPEPCKRLRDTLLSLGWLSQQPYSFSQSRYVVTQLAPITEAARCNYLQIFLPIITTSRTTPTLPEIARPPSAARGKRPSSARFGYAALNSNSNADENPSTMREQNFSLPKI